MSPFVPAMLNRQLTANECPIFPLCTSPPMEGLGEVNGLHGELYNANTNLVFGN